MEGQHTVMNGPAVYRVKVAGRIPLEWSDCLMGMNITASGDENDGQSTLVGRLPDQAALSGVLNLLYERHVPLLSVECLEVG